MSKKNNQKGLGGRTLISVALAAVFIVAAFAIIAADDVSSPADEDAYLGGDYSIAPDGSINSYLNETEDGVIRLYGNATSNGTLVVDGIELTIDLDGNTLTFTGLAALSNAIEVINGGILTITGGGTIKVVGDELLGLFVEDAYADITADIEVDDISTAVYASYIGESDEDTVTINGNITVGDGTVGIAANDGASVVITGNIVGGDGSCGVFAIDVAVVEVTGNIIVGGDGYGVQANGGKVTVDGNITVSGSITDDEYGSHGIQAGGGAEIVVTGKIKINGDGIGVFSTGSADVTVEKDIEVSAGDDIVESHGVWADGGKVTVEGSITVGDCGLGVLANDNSEVIVRGDITVGFEGTGVSANNNAIVTVDGNISAGDCDEEWSFGISTADGAKVKVTVGGNINVINGFGISAWGDSVVIVDGNVTVDKGRGIDSGVWENGDGVTITIKGKLTVGIGEFIVLWEDDSTYITFEPEEYDENGDYMEYTDDVSIVRLLIHKYSIELDPATNKDFGSMTVGYATAPAAHEIRVTNTGNRETGELTIELSGTGAESFTVSEPIPNMAIGGIADFNIVRPNTGLAVGVHTATVTVFNTANEISKTFGVTFEVTAEPEYSISLNPTSKDFGSKTVGYGGLTPFEVTVTNTGNQPTGGLTLSLTGDDDAFFIDPTIANIAVDGTGSFNVTPLNGLAVGEYTATVTIVNLANGISVNFEISFTVEEAEGLSMIVIISIAVAAIAVIGAAAWYLLFGRK